MIVAVVNQSKGLLKPQDVDLMVLACDEQVRRHFAPAYGILPVSVQLFADKKDVPAGSLVVVLFQNRKSVEKGSAFYKEVLNWAQASPVLQNRNNPGDLLGVGIRDRNGLGYARVFVEDTLVGGKPLRGSRSVSCSLSHEVLEHIGDPTVSRYAIGKKDLIYAYEVCDPVDDQFYDIDFWHLGRKQTVSVSNFVLPQWFNRQAAAKPFDHLGELNDPFTFSKEGYQLAYDSGTPARPTAPTPVIQSRGGVKPLNDPLRTSLFSRTRWRYDGPDTVIH